MKLNEIRIRDPYIVAHEGYYYLFGSFICNIADRSLRVMRSSDLIEWDEPKVIFTLDENSWATNSDGISGYCDIWAPEIHRYNGKFYLFVSLLGKDGKRGTQIAVSDTVDGIYEPIINAPSTPKADSCIDGTLYVEKGTPYMVYSADWPFNFSSEKKCYIGRICAVELTEDLKRPAGKPFVLFESDQAPSSADRPAVHDYKGETVTRYGSDAPFILRLSDGRLLLTWSPYPNMNYIVAGAISKNGSIFGKWEHLAEPIYDKNGGHAMFFEDFDGSKKMVIHGPEEDQNERTLIFNACEENGKIVLK